eukprot:6178303-Pleurochrysis_carterae.AAC.1
MRVRPIREIEALEWAFAKAVLAPLYLAFKKAFMFGVFPIMGIPNDSNVLFRSTQLGVYVSPVSGFTARG